MESRKLGQLATLFAVPATIALGITAATGDAPRDTTSRTDALRTIGKGEIRRAAEGVELGPWGSARFRCDIGSHLIRAGVIESGERPLGEG